MTSAIRARTIRMDCPAITPTRVRTGRTRISGWRSGLVPAGTSDTGGNSPSETARTAMRNVPVTNSGSDWTTTAAEDRTRSADRPARTPAQTPHPMAVGMSSAPARAARTNVLRKRRPMMARTGSPE